MDLALIAHVLNRVAFGPRADDWHHVERVGVDTYLSEQLHPEGLEDAAAQAAVARLETLKMNTATLLREYPSPQRVRRMMRDDEELDEEMTRQVAMHSLLPARQLSMARMARAIGSTRQLNEVLVDFWFNHFNVFVAKGPLRHLVIEYERDLIRPHVLRSFRDLLGGVARSPAMLVYLDNWRSGAEPDREVARRQPGRFHRHDAVYDAMRRVGFGGRFGSRRDRSRAQGPLGHRPEGLNENYARELLELHTLGVDGGYTQKDVREVARAFTGWTLELTADGGGRFAFRPDWHDAEEKVVLGQRLPAGGGIEDGETVLDILARHPSTARFLATKLCRRFVADQPPASIIDKAAATFASSGGDLRATLETILYSPEFRQPRVFGAKVKSPLEFLVSAARALGLPGRADPRLPQAVRALGQPLYGASAPTGYPDDATAWSSANALLARMRAASELAQVASEHNLLWRGRNATLEQRVDGLLEQLLPGGEVSQLRPQVLSWGASMAAAPTEAEIATLILGSPEFQRK